MSSIKIVPHNFSIVRIISTSKCLLRSVINHWNTNCS